jgi:NitT/TauT family transport system substrate-binding protein
MKMRFAALPLALLAGAGLLTACSGSSSSASSAKSGGGTVRLGFFPNITHATALVGVQKGIFAKDLGPKVTLKTATFNAGPAAVQAVFSGAIDATYVGPNPAINAWQQSHGQAIKIIAGSASGGVSLIVKPSITSIADFKGKKIATPQLGNTQDVALRFWLKQHGLKTTTSGGGDVSVVPQANSQTVQTFKSGAIDGAWVPEPYASELVAEGGKKFLDESSLWPAGKFVITTLIVRTAFLKSHPDLVSKLLQGQVDANAYINSDRAGAEQAANAELTALTGKGLKPAILDATFKDTVFTNDPIASSLATSAQHAESIGLLKPVNLSGIYDLDPLNAILKAKNQPAVNDS